jgi:hypothetical protein
MWKLKGIIASSVIAEKTHIKYIVAKKVTLNTANIKTK